MERVLEKLQEKADSKASQFIKKHRMRRCMFTLKKIRLFSNFTQELQKQTDLLEKVIIGNGFTTKEIKKITKEAEGLIADIEHVVKLEAPLKENETMMDRDEQYKILFKKHQIHNTDVHHAFAVCESKNNDITLTTSSTFKKSELTTVPNSPDSKSDELSNDSETLFDSC